MALDKQDESQRRGLLEGGRMGSPGSELRDGMCIDWDVPVPMDDGLVLCADVYRPAVPGRHEPRAGD